MKRKASAVWQGDLKSGKGAVSTESGVLKSAQYSFTTRFENGAGTNPEELVAAAHAGCFSMALSFGLQQAGFTAEKVETTATLNFDNVQPAGWTVTAIHLDTTAKVPGVSAEKFTEVANGAKANCPISRLLKADITLHAKLA
ncbi:MAG TPA: OsmC family protein [Opitutus sp.]|nr:OsmC family protein [Opitutus sp.]